MRKFVSSLLIVASLTIGATAASANPTRYAAYFHRNGQPVQIVYINVAPPGFNCYNLGGFYNGYPTVQCDEIYIPPNGAVNVVLFSNGRYRRPVSQPYYGDWHRSHH